MTDINKVGGGVNPRYVYDSPAIGGTKNVSKASPEEVLPYAQQGAAGKEGGVPALRRPLTDVTAMGMGSLVAQLNYLVTSSLSQQRAQNRDEMIAQTEAAIKEIKNQASEIRSKATKMLIIGIVTGGLQIVAGAIQVGCGISAAKAARESANMLKPKEVDGVVQAITDEVRANARMTADVAQATTLQGQGWGAIIGGIGGAINSVGQYLGAKADAAIKESEAAQQKHQSAADRLRDLNQSLMEIIRGLQQASEGTVQSQVQAMSRVMA